MDSRDPIYRKQRTKFLRRKEERRRRLEDLLPELSKIAGFRITEEDVLSLEDSDKITSEIRDNNLGLDHLNITVPKTESNKLKKFLLPLKEDLNQIHYFSTHKFREFGLLKINTKFIIGGFEKVIDLDGDMFIIYDKDLKNWLFIDLFEEMYTSENQTRKTMLYELRVSGKDWMKQVAKEYLK